MVKYALSDNKEDLKKNLLKFVAKKLIVSPCGAVISGGGAVLKTMTNTLYPIQSIKRLGEKGVIMKSINQWLLIIKQIINIKKL